ncbi:MAG: glycosyltransferase [Fulvivirga sp.]
MILLTIGTTESFDRLVEAMDIITPRLDNTPVIAQISETAYLIRNMSTVGFLSPSEYYRLFNSASLIISHAGMGTIISALMWKKPIIVMPRRSSLGEANSDHQYATAKRLAELNYIRVAHDQEQLMKLIKLTLNDKFLDPISIGSFASDRLINSLKKFINE